MKKGIGLSALLAAALVVPLPAQGWETIASDYRNVRGVNFHPSYPTLDGTPGYVGTASHTALWGFYDPLTTGVDVQDQLRMAKKMGINTVRVFLSFVVWEYFDTVGPAGQFEARLDHFLTLCEAEHIRVMPVVWDFVSFANPVTIPEFTSSNRITSGPNVDLWHASLSFPRGFAEYALPGPFVNKPTGRYVAACSAVFGLPHRDPNVLLAWDVGNEPVHIPEASYFVTETMALLKSLRSTDKVLYSGNFNDRFPYTLLWGRDVNCDIIGIHVYGMNSPDILEAFVWDATHDGATLLGKPVIATEIGAPGAAVSYQDMLIDTANVPRPDLGPGVTGVGFCPWQFMIGFRDTSVTPPIDDHYPLKEGNGIFYAHPDASGNAQVRDLGVVQAFVNTAIAQGIPANTLWFGTPALSNIVAMSPSNPQFVKQLDLGLVTSQRWFQTAALLAPPSMFALSYTWDDYKELSAMFRSMTWMFLDLKNVVSSGNSNPYALTTAAWYNLTPTQVSTLEAMCEETTWYSPNFLPMLAMLEANNGYPTGYLRPWDPTTGHQAADLFDLFTQVLLPLQQALAPVILPRM